MSDDIDRSRLTLEVLTLMDQGFQAKAKGDQDGFDRAIQAAVRRDVDCVSVVQGGMIIGEIPNPEFDMNGWDAYFAAARQALGSAQQ